MPIPLIGPKFVDGVLPLILSAQKTIDIIIFDWRIYDNQPGHPVMRLTKALADAVERGVDVRVLMTHDGVREYLERRGIKTKRLYSGKLVHAKFMLIDEQVAILGSHNYTQSAFTQNLEISVAIELGDRAEEFISYFNHLWGV